MLILGIESSCDETGAAVIEADSKNKKVKLLSNSLATSLSIHAKSGGIIPENAAREQVKFIIPVIKDALKKANLKLADIDKIAVTYGPGLIGSLLVGVETAKTLSYIYSKPLIPTNHLLGHIYANFIDEGHNEIKFPLIALVVSGGHTDLVLITNHGNYKWLGGTRDDAAGEAMDKIGRLLSLPYPGGPFIEKAALDGINGKYIFPKPLDSSGDYDFSFSGLKTAVFREVQNKKLDKQDISDISFAVQKSIVDILVKKTTLAAIEHNAACVLLGGGVAANQTLRNKLTQSINKNLEGVELFVPSKILCTDNGAMIAAAAFYNDSPTDFKKVDANPNLYF
jgi:N6-L-threonylcarbamoyladenine synthase